MSAIGRAGDESARQLLERLLERDASLWPEGNVSGDRLGWLASPRRMREEAEELRAWADSIEASRIVLIGMGGSSLGPEVLRQGQDDSDRLVVLDTTDPATVASVDLDGAFVVVSSKSGGTLEVRTLFAHCWQQLPDGSRYAAITDPGTGLASLAEEHGFSRTFTNPPDIGGRYSVLSYFGLVPAALLGYDLVTLCDRALGHEMVEAAALGRTMGEAAKEGRDKVTIVVPPTFRAFGLWAEQLIAESTGKRGTGLVPVPTLEVEEGADRNIARVHIGDQLDLGVEFLRWEVATAIAGHLLDIDPFDEPNVAESKANTQKVLENLPLDPTEAVDDPGDTFAWLVETVRPGDYVSLQAYLPYGWAKGTKLAVSDRELEQLRRKVRDHLGGMAVTAGYGPRFLHSTGQLHKGGPDKLVAVQIVPRTPTAEVPVPGYDYDFGTLIAAQALGDYRSLKDHGRRVLRVAVDELSDIT